MIKTKPKNDKNKKNEKNKKINTPSTQIFFMC